MEWANPPEFPSLTLPEAPVMPPTIFEVPQGELPSYTPLVVPPNTLQPPAGVQPLEIQEEPPKEDEKEQQKETKSAAKPAVPKIKLPPEAQIVEIPFTDVEVPLPSATIMTTAATTAVISVAATLTATSLFKYIVMILKPVFKQTWNKITKRKPDLSNSLSSSGQQDS